MEDCNLEYKIEGKNFILMESSRSLERKRTQKLVAQWMKENQLIECTRHNARIQEHHCEFMNELQEYSKSGTKKILAIFEKCDKEKCEIAKKYL